MCGLIGRVYCLLGRHPWELWRISFLDKWRAHYLFRCRRLTCEAARAEPNYKLECQDADYSHSLLGSHYPRIAPSRLGPPAPAGSSRTRALVCAVARAQAEKAQPRGLRKLSRQAANPQPGPQPHGQA